MGATDICIRFWQLFNTATDGVSGMKGCQVHPLFLLSSASATGATYTQSGGAPQPGAVDSQGRRILNVVERAYFLDGV